MHLPVEQSGTGNGAAAVGDQVKDRSQWTNLSGKGQRYCERRIDVSAAYMTKALDEGGHGEATGESNDQPIGCRAEDEHGARPGEVCRAEEENVEEGGQALGNDWSPKVETAKFGRTRGVSGWRYMLPMLLPLSVEGSLTSGVHSTEQVKEDGFGRGGRAVWAHFIWSGCHFICCYVDCWFCLVIQCCAGKVNWSCWS